ncbi:RNA polymerase sigma-70 factor (ECF subfamily) [Pseudobacter ginsenosidimutans]|uniref:RNA polymerase sigma-70 factor (ECF subfamily) n=1 Tax=Pseudobacter ginsenosidimutans TaxID=661488 RepID=A0A4Q7N1Q9_9BACT|nr:sigma-70 family RNA polymerase sigma factor [Pseudobacter ginsenosidimutans]RZS74524.1 RNA polymerase sigma-70 factor (ECF subfamily) [Pseudobacter ginsenosidimutans]
MPIKGSYEEKELLARLATGDKSAFDTLYHYYEPRLRLFLTPFTRSDAHLLNVILQDTFVKCWIKRNDLAGIEHLEYYLQRMAKNRLLDLLKLQKIQSNHIGHYAQLQEQSVQLTGNQLQLKEYMSIARRGIDALPERRREIFSLSVFDGLSIDEIAGRMNLSREVVKKQLQKARTFLKTYIAEKGDLPVIVGGLIIGSLHS